MKDNEENRQIFGSFIIAVINLFLAITSFFDGLVIFVIIPLFFLICSSIIFYRTVKTRRDNKKHKALQALYSQKIYHDSVAGSFSHIIYFNNAQKIATIMVSNKKDVMQDLVYNFSCSFAIETPDIIVAFDNERYKLIYLKKQRIRLIKRCIS